jgi:hypothetical protein
MILGLYFLSRRIFRESASGPVYSDDDLAMRIAVSFPVAYPKAAPHTDFFSSK